MPRLNLRLSSQNLLKTDSRLLPAESLRWHNIMVAEPDRTRRADGDAGVGGEVVRRMGALCPKLPVSFLQSRRSACP